MQTPFHFSKKYLKLAFIIQISRASLIVLGISLMCVIQGHATANRVWGEKLSRGHFSDAKQYFNHLYNFKKAIQKNPTLNYMDTIHSSYIDRNGVACYTLAKIFLRSKCFGNVFSSMEEQRKKGFEMLVYAGAQGHYESHELLLHLDRHATGPTPSVFAFSDQGYVFSDVAEKSIIDFQLNIRPSFRRDRARFYNIYQELYDREGVPASTKTYAGQLLGGRLIRNDEPVYLHYSDEIPATERINIDQITGNQPAPSESKISEEEEEKKADIARMLDGIVLDD